MTKNVLLWYVRLVFLSALPWLGIHASAQSQVPVLKSSATPKITTGHNNLRKLAKMHDAQAQKGSIQRVVDDPQSRVEYEWQLLKDPKTNLIPDQIREKELLYAKSRLKTQANARTMTTPWKARGPYNVGGRTRAVAIDLTDENIILAGGVSGGMWRSVDGGASWKKTTNSSDLHSVTAVAQDPREGFRNVWYYTTGERIGNSASDVGAFYLGNGIYKSIDGGQSWQLLPSTAANSPQSYNDAFELIFGVVVNPVNGDVYASTSYGVYRSTNGGASFQNVLDGGPDTFTDVIVTSTGVLYATLDNRLPANSPNAGVFRSVDGVVWTAITPAGFTTVYHRMVLGIAPSNENILYLLAYTPGSGTFDTQLWKYTYTSGNGTGAGGAWENRSANIPALGNPVGNFNPQTGYNLVVKVYPTDPNIVFLGGTNLYRSFNGFASPITAANWIGGYATTNNVNIYPNHHPDQHGLVFYPSNPARAISAHDGGVSLTDNVLSTNTGGQPVVWTSLNNGYLTTQPYVVSIDQKGTGDELLAGFQDNGTWFTSSGTLTAPWSEAFGGDGSYNAIANGGLTRYVSAQNGNTYRLNYASADSEEEISFTRITPLGATGFLFINPFILDPNNDKVMYMAGGNRIWRNDNLDGIPASSNAPTSVNWNNLTRSVVASGTVSSLAVSRSPANRLYYGTTTGGIYRIENANLGDQPSTNVAAGKGLPTGNVSSIAIDPTNADRVFVTFSNYSILSVFYSDNGGTSWTNISGNLEQNPDGSGTGPSVRWISILGNNDAYFLGTSTGLYSTRTLNGPATTWVQEDAGGIGNVVVPMVKTRDDGFVAVASHGNGLYSARFEVTPIPSATLTIANPLEDLELFVNAPNTVLDLSAVFSESNPDNTIALSIYNSNPSLVKATLDGNLLTLSYTPGAVGSALIGVIATSGGTSVSVTFRVTIKNLEYALYQQNSSNAGTVPSQLFTDFNGLVQSADDFVVPTGQTWNVDRVFAAGAVNGAPVLNKARVIIYADNNGKPGAEVFNSGELVPTSATNNPNLTIQFTNAATLSGGTYWISVFPVLAFNGSNQWFWQKQTPVRGNESYFRDAANLFGRGATDWTKASVVFTPNPPADLVFTLFGNGNIPAPAAPSDLTATAVSPYRFELTWQDNSDNEIGFLIERSTDSDSTFTKRTVVGPGTTKYVDTDVFDRKLVYAYRVSAIGVGNTSAPSNIARTAVKPEAPWATPAKNVMLTQFTATWTPVEGAEYYVLDISTDNFNSFVGEYEHFFVNGTELEVQNIDPNVTYQYRVRAMNSGGISDYSNVIVVGATRALQLASVCSPNPGESRRWRVRNPNPFDVVADWQLYGSDITATIVFAPGESFFLTPTISGPNTLVLSWLTDKDVNVKTTKASQPSACSRVGQELSGIAEVAPLNSESVSPDSALSAFPNPVTDKLTVQLSNADERDVTLRLFNSQGKKMYQEKKHLLWGTSQVLLNTSAWPSGLYIITVEENQLIKSIKVVKNK